MSAPVPYYTFVGGINTEANPLTFPPNTCLDADNVILLRDGSLRSRLGIDYEADYVRVGPVVDPATSIPIDVSRASKMATGVGTWPSVGGNGALEFTIVQMGSILYFHDATQGATSGYQLPFTVNLDDYKIQTISYEDQVEFASGNGLLFVAGPQMNPIYIEYDPDTNSISVTAINIKIRDFEGVDDGLAVDLRPPVLSTEHDYNLRNQGWPNEFLCAGDPLTADTKDHPFITDPVNQTKVAIGVYPSNADTLTSGYTTMANGSRTYWPHEMTAANLGTSPAPKGRFVVNAFDIDRSGVSGIPGIPKVVELSRPATIAFYAGRVWYAGLDVGKNTGKVYFSQLVEDDTKIIKCYQEADPTSEDVSDLVDTDGGVIPIPDAGQIIKIITIGRSIIVFATNGIWEITGVDQSSFTATGYSINKVGEQGVESAQAVVAAESQIYFIGKDGLYRLTKEQITDGFQVEDMSSNTIQTLLNNISPYGKDFSLGVYDPEERRITWFFNSTDLGYTYQYDRALVYDLILNAFYPLTIGTALDYPVVGGVVASRRFNFTADPTNVTETAVDVTVSGTDVFLDTQTLVKDPLQYKFLTVWRDANDGWYYYTFSEFKNTNFKDWENFDKSGLYFDAYIEPGYQLINTAATKKQVHYLYTFLERTEQNFETNSKGQLVLANPSSCFLTVKWGWSDSANSGKWTTPRQVYRHRRFYMPGDPDIFTSGDGEPYDYGESVIVSKSKLRGSGNAIRFRFQNEAGKDMHLYGWQVYYNGNPLP
jgi:hypothetical protein